MKEKPAKVTKPLNKEDGELLKELMDNVSSWYKYYNEHIERARNYLNFLYVDQWTSEDRSSRTRIGKPTLQFNKLVPIVRGILGEQRNNSPQLAVRSIAVDKDQDDQNVLNVITNLLRQVAYKEKADIAYQTASKHMLECGWGAVRIGYDYKSPDSFEQELKIYPIHDFQAAFFDSTAILGDKSDGDFCGTYTTMSKKKYAALYPDKPNPQSVGDNYFLQWNSQDTITMIQIFYKEYFNEDWVQLSNGEDMKASEANKLIKLQEEIMLANVDNPMAEELEVLEIVNKKTAKDYTIKHCTFVANYILEKSDWPGKLLPIVHFEGDSTVIDGERLPLPFVQDAIEPQKMINYMVSELAYQLSASRREQFMGTPANVKGFEDIWRQPQNVQGILTANPDPETGELPKQIETPAFNPMLLQALDTLDNQLQQNLGRYEEARGQESNAISGVAIDKRQKASNAPVNVYDDNWQRGIQQCGRVQLDLIPHIYNTEQDVVTRNIDGETKSVTVNKFAGFSYTQQGEIKPVIENDITKKLYDIEVQVNGSYETQKQTAFQMLTQLIAVAPQAAPLVMDLLANVSGLENAQQLKSRLKTLVPPEILAEEAGLPPPPPPPPPPPDPDLVNAKIKGMLGMADIKLKDKGLDIQREKNQIEMAKNKLDVSKTLIKSSAEVDKSNNEALVSLLNQLRDIATLGITAQQTSQSASDKEIQTIQGAEQRRETLDEQAQILKGIGI